MAQGIDYNALRAQTMGAGEDEEAVTVNTRSLIDKVLARYSGEWTVLRELLQNAADASASKVIIKFETIPSTAVPVPQSSNPSALLQHTLLHHTLRRLLVTNNGQPFGGNDWSRLKRIAEGNPDETKIGAFGVGFYSVFADCEEPFISSGKEAMAFYWKGNSLFTRRLQLSEEQSTPDTSFVLDYRNKTSAVPALLPLNQFLASSLTFVGLTNIELWLDDWKLLTLGKVTAPPHSVQIPKSLETKTVESLMHVVSVIREMAQLDAKWLNIVGWDPKTTSKNITGMTPVNTAKGGASSQSLRTFFSRFSAGTGSSNLAAEKAARDERAAQEAIAEDLMGECKATVFLHINTATIRTSCTKAFSQELERATKKPPPKTTKIAVLTSSYNEKQVSASLLTGTASKTTNIFNSVLPDKSGRIYIGFPTHQKTGLNAHISAQSVIPTVERESIDLNARWVRTWNMEMLRAAGIVCRVAWSGEIDSVKNKLSETLARDKRSKISKNDIDAALPEAIHVLNQFTFRESTPSSQVGNLVEEAFWTCDRSASIDILSSRGVLPSHDVRIAADDLSFVGGIPVLPQALVTQASSFVKKLTDYGIITEITTSDIKKALEAQALDTKQLIEFLHWIGHKARINEVDNLTLRSLLDVTVANDEEDGTGQGKLLMLAEIKYFINPSKIPANLPSPTNTIPFRLTKDFDRIDLEALGWEDLQVVPWLRWLIENTGGHKQLSIEQDLTKSPAFASQVLPVVSKQWDGFSLSSKTTIIELMSSRTVIPTKLGMKLPKQSYFPSVKLFDDLPVVTGLHSVKEKVLAAFGVRKTIELGLIFDRLMAPPEYTEDASAAKASWSHVDLIRYLATVRNDIPANDVKRLKSTPICLAEESDIKAVNNQRHLVADLFEPNELLRSLGLRLLQWPGVYRPSSEEGKFLTFLGLKCFPHVSEMVTIISNASATGNSDLRDRALKYFIDHHHAIGFSNYDIKSIPTPFLPLQGSSARVVSPSQCFTNERAAIMGYDILRKDLQPHASKFGVQVNPSMIECVDRLVKNPPDSHRKATEVFGYFSERISEMSDYLKENLGRANIIPISDRTLSEKSTVRFISPTSCFIGKGGRYEDIFDYTDFGNGNTFLLHCGSKHEPTTSELARLVVREPTRIFNSIQIERYTDLLRSLADAWSSIKKDKPLVKEMRRAPFLLGYKELPSDQNMKQPKATGSRLIDIDDDEDEENGSVRTCQLVAASQVVILDDVISYNLFKATLLAAPLEEKLEVFYESLGSSSLADLVEEQPHVGKMNENQSDALKLQSLVNERAKLFLHDTPPSLIQFDSRWLEKNLAFVSVQTLSLRKSLKGLHISHNKPTNAATVYDQRKGWILYFIPGKHDLFDISQALIHLILHRPKPQQAMMLDMLLSTDLPKLKRRGYNVDRILRLKAAEARVAEDQRKAQLEAEQQKIKDQEAAWHEDQRRQQQMPMPGVFPDSPDRNVSKASKLNAQLNAQLNDELFSKKPRGLFSEITKRLGIDDSRRNSQANINAENSQALLPSYAQEDKKQPLPIPTSTPPKPITAPHDLQQNLLSAVQSARAYNSQSVKSQSTFNEVKETQTYCDSKPAQNITFFATSTSGIKIFLSNFLSDKEKFMAQNASAVNTFAAVLLDCAGAFSLSPASIHIFYEDKSSTIAFNQSKALFFNHYYFEQLHLEAVLRGERAAAIVYWFVAFAHELAHNLVADHSAAHSYYAESFVVQYFGEVAMKVAERGVGALTDG